MAGLPFWQLAAGFVAAVFAVAAAAAFIRYPRPLMLVVSGLMVGIPIVGFIGYALIPGPTPDPGALVWLGFAPALAGIAAGVWMLAWSSARRSTLTAANLEMLSNGMLIAFAGFVLAVSDVLAIWQPAWAVANLCLNAAWVAAWIPRRVRTSNVETRVEIAAPRARVYSFIADPLNWPAYQEDLVSVHVRPAGPLAPGSEVEVQQRYESGVRGPRMLPDTITVASVVDEVVPQRRIGMHLAASHAARSEMDFEDAGSGTSISVRTTAVAPFRLAVFGALVELRTQRPRRLARARRNLERLKEILESS